MEDVVITLCPCHGSIEADIAERDDAIVLLGKALEGEILGCSSRKRLVEADYAGCLQFGKIKAVPGGLFCETRYVYKD